MKIYISGKITGMEAEAAKLFQAAEDSINERGSMAVNPMKLPHDHDKSWESYMKEAITELLKCDKIYMLQNWQQSNGAWIEYRIAAEMKIPVIYQ